MGGARSDSDSATKPKRPSKRSRKTAPAPPLINDNLLPHVLPYLKDIDILCRLLITGRCVKPFLIDHRVSKSVNSDLAKIIIGRRRYCPVKVLNLTDAVREDMRRHPELVSLEFHHEFNGVISEKGPGKIPRTVRSLDLGELFIQALSEGDIFDHKLMVSSKLCWIHHARIILGAIIICDVDRMMHQIFWGMWITCLHDQSVNRTIDQSSNQLPDPFICPT